MAQGFDKAIKAALEEVKEERSASGGPFAEPVIPERTWTNAEGKPLVASVTEITANSVKFKLKNGQQVVYEIAKLSEDDQALIKEKTAGDE